MDEALAMAGAQAREASAALLQVDNLYVRYPLMGLVKAGLLGVKNRFLDAVLDVSFSLQAGTTVGLVRELGSGRSTLGPAIERPGPSARRIDRFHGHALPDIASGAAPGSA